MCPVTGHISPEVGLWTTCLQRVRRRHASGVDWADLARTQDGVIARHQLRRLGLSDSGITRRLGSGALTVCAPGVFLVRGAPLTYRAGLWRAVLATDGVLGFATAAHLWGMLDEPPALVDVVVAPERHVTIPRGVRVHRTVVPSWAVARRAGLPATSRAWALLDHLGRQPWPVASRLADRALQRGWLRADDVTRRLAAHPGRHGNGILRRLAAQLGDGAAAESERLLHRLLRRAGVTRWVPNHEVWVAGDLVAVLDVAVPHARLAVEVDGMAYHVDVERFQRDRTRQNRLVGLGWTVLRFTWADLVERPGYVVASIRAHLARAS